MIFVPGHAPGHVAFVNKEQKVCIGGDVLFDGSIGRTDLPGGNSEVLINSIHEKMFVLDDDMVAMGVRLPLEKKKPQILFVPLKSKNWIGYGYIWNN